MTKLDELKANSEFQRVLADSFGGVCYMKHPDDYNRGQILRIWELMTPGEQDAAGGIVSGAISFLEGDE